MTETKVMEILTGAGMVVGKLAGPILAACLGVGVVVALVQTVTQLQESTLTFVPKLLAAAGVLAVGGHWMIQQLTGWVHLLWSGISTL